MKNESTNRTSMADKMILVGIGLGILFWIVDSAIHVFLLHEGNLIQQVFVPDPHEIWKRSLTMGILIMFGLYSQVATTKRKKMESKIAHLNAVLRAIRNVNQLIIKEKDRDRLLQGICDNLIETKGYYYVWIALMDESGIFVTSAQAGLGERLSSMVDRLKSGQIVNCAREALTKSHIIITDNIRDICGECPLISECKGRESMTIPLRHRDKVYGIIAASVPIGVATDEEEQLLFLEVAQDIAFALLNIEVEEKRKRSEEALVQEHQLMQALMDNIPDSIYFKDDKNRFIRVNKAKAEHSGTTPESMRGKTDFDFFPQEQAKEAFADDNRVMESNRPLLDKIQKITHADGTEHWVSITKIPRYNERGKVIGTMGISRNITERKRIEQMKDDFVSLVSHELRTPLTSIGGYVDLILDGDVGEINKEQREFLQIISENTQRLEALINDVLDIEKTESGRVKLKLEKVNLNEVVEDCINTFEVMAQDKGLKLEKEIKVAQIEVLGDSDRLSQAFSNLLSNAIKYTKEGRVKVTAQTKGKFASVTVEDTGVGMSQEDLKRIFTRFFRAEDSYVRKTSGTGLGLSIAKATIERHNGDIMVESKLGVGSNFEVILPLLKETKKGANGKENSFGRG